MATILQIANADNNLSYFSKGLRLSGLEEKLNESGPYTLLIPVNLAFSRMNDIGVEELFSQSNSEKLLSLLSDHILVGKKMYHDFSHGRKFKTLSGKEVSVEFKNGDIRINDARLLSRDRQARNGVVHSVDSVVEAS